MKIHFIFWIVFCCGLFLSPQKSSGWCGDSLKVIISRYDYDTVPTAKVVYHYDSLGREYSEYAFSWNGISWDQTGRKLTSYWNDSLPYEVLHQWWDGAQWITSELARYTYNNHGIEITSLDSVHYFPSGYTSIVFVETTRDPMDRATQITSRHWNGTEWINNYRYSHFYDASGRDTLFFQEHGDSLSWVNYESRSYSFDMYGNNNVQIFLTWNGTQWLNMFRYTGFFIALARDTLNYNQQGDSLGWNNANLHRTTYDSIGNTIYTLFQTGTDTIWNNYQQSFFYFTDSLIDSSLTQYWNAGAWENSLQTTYTYDSLSRLELSLSRYYNNGTWTNYRRHVNYYLANGRIDFETDDTWGNYQWEIECVFTPEYDGGGNLLYLKNSCDWGGCGGRYYHADYDADSILIHAFESYTNCGGDVSEEDDWYYYNQIQGDSIVCDSGSTLLSAASCPGYSYLWNTGDTTAAIVADTVGVYTVTITNGTHQIYTSPFYVYLLTANAATHDPDSVLNGCGSISFQLKEHAVPFASYAWLINDTLVTNSNYIGHPEWYRVSQSSAQGSYRIIVTTPCGIDTSSATFVYFHASPVVNITSSGPAYFCDGDSVALVADSGFVSYSWSITNDTTASTIAHIKGTYTVTVTDSNGCSASDDQFVNVFPLPVQPLIYQDGGLLHISDSAFANNWFHDSLLVQSTSSGTFYSPQNGWYQVQAVTNNGCLSYSLPFYFDSDALVAQAGLNKVICKNDSVVLGGNFPAYGGIPPYSYLWSPVSGLNDPSISNPNASPDSSITYYLTVTDSTGSFVTDSVNVLVHALPAPVIYSNTGPDTCAGSFKQFSAVTSHAQTYYWHSNGSVYTSTDANFSQYYSQDAIIYVEVLDSNHCLGRSADYIFNVHPFPPTPILNNSYNIALCPGDSILLVASNLDTASMYLWQLNGSITLTGINDSSVYANQNGSYIFKQTNVYGCSRSAYAFIDQSDSVINPQIYVNHTNLCEGDSALLYTTEIPDYIYQWYRDLAVIPAADSASMWVTETGDYMLYLISPGGCSGHSYSRYINVGPVPDVTIYRVNDTLLFSPDVNGSFQWFEVGDSVALGTDSYFIPPHEGDYYVWIFDYEFECSAASLPFHYFSCSASYSISNIHCASGCDGSISATAVNGYAPFTFIWNTGDTTATLDSLCSGNYYFTMSDDSGCTATYYPTLTSPSPLGMNTTSSPVLCNGDCNGSATALASGGILPYNYLWSNGETGNVITNICSGQYSVIVTDSNGCADTSSLMVSEPSPIVSAFTGIDVLCNGQCNGSYISNVTGGVPPYSFSVCGGGNLIPGTLCPAVYCVSIIDVNGCDTTTSFTVNEPIALTANISVQDPSCAGCSDGFIFVDPFGGTWPYAITWIPGNGFLSGDSILNLPSGNYSVTVTDSNGCIYSNNYILVDPPDITPNIISGNIFEIYPNPVTDKLVLVFGNNISNEIASVKVYNALGQILVQKEIVHNCELNVTDLDDGLYRIEVKSKNFFASKKFVKIAGN